MAVWGVETPSKRGLCDRIRTPRFGGEAHVYVQASRLKICATSRLEGFQTPLPPVLFSGWFFFNRGGSAMKKSVLAIIITMILTGCLSPEQQLAEDNNTCIKAGYQNSLMQCVQAIQQQRVINQRNFDNALSAVFAQNALNQQRQQQQSRMDITCNMNCLTKYNYSPEYCQRVCSY